MNGNVLTRVLDWLRAGYPEGVPPKDYTPLLALLRPGEDEVRRVAALLADRGVPLSTKAQRIVGDREILAGAAAEARETAESPAAAPAEDAVDPSPIAQALRWLGAGYPEGIPAQDRVPILALLRRRLTDAEVQEVCEAVAAQSGADPQISLVDAQVLMMKVLGELPGEDDVERVRARLEESGITLS